MGLKDDSLIFSKVSRSSKNQNIHNLFIFNHSGICIYGKNITNSYDFEQHLVSSFFSALMSFTSEMMGDKIKTIEMSGIKFVIIQQDQFYYCVLCHSIENLVLLEDIVNKINKKIQAYIKKNNINTSTEYLIGEDLDNEIDQIITKFSSNEFDLGKELKIVEYLQDLLVYDEITGTILLTDKGKVIHSSLDKVELRNFLKEVDFRVKIWNNSILKMFYTSKNNELIFSEYVGDLYLIILVFSHDTKFGVAGYYLNKAVDFINKTLGL